LPKKTFRQYAKAELKSSLKISKHKR
jgi:hypothetical protein